MDIKIINKYHDCLNDKLIPEVVKIVNDYIGKIKNIGEMKIDGLWISHNYLLVTNTNESYCSYHLFDKYFKLAGLFYITREIKQLIDVYLANISYDGNLIIDILDDNERYEEIIIESQIKNNKIRVIKNIFHYPTYLIEPYIHHTTNGIIQIINTESKLLPQFMEDYEDDINRENGNSEDDINRENGNSEDDINCENVNYENVNSEDDINYENKLVFIFHDNIIVNYYKKISIIQY
jgi:hypothetical protein